MNATDDRLDDAIDQVAKRLTQVADDGAVAPRILAALPDRSPWALLSWIPRLAITAALVAAASLVVLRPFYERSTDVLRTENAIAPFVEFRAVVDRTSVEPELIVRRTIVERSQNVRRTIEDFDRSLSAIDAPAALALGTLAPRDLPSQGSLAVEPLTIADLPLAENNVPR